MPAWIAIHLLPSGFTTEAFQELLRPYPGVLGATMLPNRWGGSSRSGIVQTVDGAIANHSSKPLTAWWCSGRRSA